MERWAERLVAWRAPLFALALVVSLAAWPVARRAESDQALENLFAPDDVRLAEFRRAAATFGGDATMLAVYRDPAALTPAGLDRLRAMRERLAQVPFVTSALCLADLPHPRDPTLWRDLAGAVGDGAEAALREGLRGLQNELASWQPRSLRDWFSQAKPGDLPNLKQEVLATDLYRDVFVSADGTTVAVMLTLDRDAVDSGRALPTLATLREIVRTAPEPGHIVGAAVMVSDVHRYLTDDAARLQWTATGAMLLVVWLVFRGVRWIAAPLVVVWTAGLWTRAIAVTCGIRQSLIASMTESLITVIGVATVVHIAVFFAEETKREPNEERALERTLARSAGAFAWTSVITAVGFLALLVSAVRPVREYAIVMATAAVFVGLATFLLIPGAALFGRRFMPAAPQPGWADGPAALFLEAVARFVGRHALTASVTLVVAMCIASGGFRKLELETEFTKNFRADAPILASYNFVETNLGGVGVVEVSIPASAVTPDFVENLRACAAELSRLGPVTKVNGLHDVLDYAERLLGSQRLLGTSVPPPPGAEPVSAPRNWAARLANNVVDRALLATLGSLPAGQARSLVRNFWNPDVGRTRLVMRVRERQAVEDKATLVADVEAIVRKRFGQESHATGAFVLLVFLVGQLVRDQWLAVAASAVGVVVTASVAFRSVRLGLAAFAPKLVLVTAVIGTMGWIGLKVNVATAMIGSVSMGLVVAFSVPYLNRFRQERIAGANFQTALERTHGSAGKAMIFANAALVLGFSVLASSQFLPTVHFGALVSVAVCGGVIGNLVLLPVVLKLLDWRPPLPPRNDA